MKRASNKLDEDEARGGRNGRRRVSRLLLVAAFLLLPAFPHSARPPQRKEGQPPTKQRPTPDPSQRPTLKVSATAEPSSLELCPKKPASVRLSASRPERAAGFASYAWKASAGRIEGEGATVTWDLSGAKPGVHAAEVFVSLMAPAGAPLANGRALARVNLRECRAEESGQTQNTGQGSPAVVTDPQRPENTSSPTPRTPTPTPTASPAPAQTPAPASASASTPPDTISTPAPASAPAEAAPAEPSGFRAASYFWPALVILLLLLAVSALILRKFLKALGRTRTESPTLGSEPPPRPDREVPTEGAPHGGGGRQREVQAEGGVPVAGATEDEEVLCSVFAPHAVAPGDGFLVQAFAHLEEQAALLPGLAKEAEQRAERRGTKALGQVARGQELRFHLEAPGLEVDEPSQSIVWRGRVESAQFGVSVPESFAPRAVNCKLTIIHPDMLGHIRFTINVAAAAPAGPPDGRDSLALFDKLVRYRQAFVSYASEDRAEVLKRVQMLQAMRVKFFQDVLSLEPGERWRKELYRNIDASDVFLLFWSKAASRSEWVEREARYALARKAGGDETPPEIVPVILQGPPEVPPPGYLSELHFNDPLAYFIRAAEAERRPADDA